jgi:hypothetical protein
MKTTPSPRESFLREAASDLARLPAGQKDIGRNPLFDRDIQELDGFNLAFMNPARFEELCARYGIDPDSSEAVMMQTRLATLPHLHEKGDSLFLPLGPEEGFKESAGGTYLGEPFEYIPAIPGQTFHVPAGQAHFFKPAPGANFSAIACVSPRIQRSDGSFDIRHVS